MFTAERLARLKEVESWHFWFHGRRILINQLLNRESLERHPLHLEIGCGTGRTAKEMSERGHRVVAVDLRPEGLEAVRKANPSAILVRADATKLPFRRESFDLVTALDVLEHLDDSAALTELRAVICPKGILILSVPAMPWLWSARDVHAGHMRRYSPSLLRAALERAHLGIVALRYYQFVLFPLVVVSRLLGKGSRGLEARDREETRIPGVNKLLGWVNGAEAIVAARVSLPWGSSLVAVCRPA
jgi:SAM-dependent methyltransferase